MSNDVSLEVFLEQKPRILWVGAHPDDESFAGAFMAWASLGLGCPLHMLVLTHGEGGEGVQHGEGDDLATIRAGELAEVARLYRSGLEMDRYWNAPLPVESFPKRQDLAAKWMEHGDPALRIARTIRSVKPDLVLTFAPIYGATGHPEHQLTARFTTQAVRMAACDVVEELDGEPHRTARTYFFLSRYRFLAMLGMKMDPMEPTDVFDGRRRLPDGRTCFRAMADNTLPHRTQKKDMGMMRLVSRFLHKVYLRRTDPFTETWDPFEPRDRGGMG